MPFLVKTFYSTSGGNNGHPMQNGYNMLITLAFGVGFGWLVGKIIIYFINFGWSKKGKF